MLRLAVCFLLSPFFVNAQEGLSTPWQLKQKLEALTNYCRRLTPIIDQLRPREWKDSSPGYVEQQHNVQSQLRSLLLISGKVVKDPERLPEVLDLYFRYESFDVTLGSLIEGIRRYQNPAIAELITGMRTDNAGIRQNLKDYMLELAATKEQEFRIADAEAQRCRAGILKKK